jgi:hypothetical protein
MEKTFDYKIEIGSVYDITEKKILPSKVILITSDQFEVIRMFANTKIDEYLNTIYKINNVEFKVVPNIQIPKFTNCTGGNLDDPTEHKF